MSKYTTEVRFICEVKAGMTESKGFNSVSEIIEKARPNIFNFSYPIFDESYKPVLESKILKHYYTREISEETVGLWLLRLDTKLNEIMPYYNKLYQSELLEYNPLYTTNLITTKNRKADTNNNVDENIGENRNTKNTGTVQTTGTNNGTVQTTETTQGTVHSDGTTNSEEDSVGTNENTRWELYSDTPQGSIQNIGLIENAYLTNAKKTTDDGETHNITKGVGANTNDLTSDDKSDSLVKNDNKTDTLVNNNLNTDVNSTIDRKTKGVANTVEDYLESVVGYTGKNANELIMEFRKTFLNIDMMIIDELEMLFMQLW